MADIADKIMTTTTNNTVPRIAAPGGTIGYDSTRYAAQCLAVNKHALTYRSLDAITAEQAAQIDKNRRRIDEATACAYNYEQHVAEKAAELAHTGDPISAAGQLPSREAVYAVAQAQHDNAATENWGILSEAKPKIISAINDELQELRNRGLIVGAQVKHLRDGGEAIDANLVDEWREFTTLAARYVELTTLIHQLRADRLLPNPRLQRDSGPHWSRRNDLDGTLNVHMLPEHQRNYELMRSDVYACSGQEEADAVLASWDNNTN